MVALVVILNDGLPVGLQLHIPDVVVLVAPREVKILHSRLLIDTAKLVFPLDVWFACLEVNPDEASGIHANVDREKAILALIEAGYRIESRRFGKVTFEPV